MFIINEIVVGLKWSDAYKALTLAQSIYSIIIAASAIMY